MKPFRNSLFVLFVLAFFLTACAGAEFQGEQSKFRETYPGQFLAGDVYILKNHEKIDGDIAGIGTTLIIEEGAIVIGNISLVGSNLEISGRVAGDINVFAGSSLIKESALITGSINQVFHQITIDPDAQVYGEINTYQIPTRENIDPGKGLSRIVDWFQPSSIILIEVLKTILFIILSILAIFLLKKQTLRGVVSLEKNLIASWGAGLITMISVPIISLVFLITICLSPFALILIIAFLICLMWGWVMIAAVVGQQLSHWLRLDWKVELATVIGAILISVFTALISIIPCIGFLINTMIASAGLGGVLISRFGSQIE